MKQALVTLNFVVIAVLVTIVAMQHRADAGAKPAVVGGPIPGLTLEEIPVDRFFSFHSSVANMNQGSPAAPWTTGNVIGFVNFIEFPLPSNVGLFLSAVQPFRKGTQTPIPNFAVYVNGVIAFCGPQQYLAGGPSITSTFEAFFVPPGAVLRVEVEDGLDGFNVQGAYVSATELSLP